MAAGTVVAGGWIDGVTINAAGLRGVSNALAYRDATGIRPGVVYGFDDPLGVFVDNADLGMFVKVRPGRAILPGGYELEAGKDSQGGYLKVALDAADGSYPRLDLIVADVNDTGTSAGWFQLRAITGTPSQTPAAPATPATAVALRTVSVPAAQSNINSVGGTDLRSWTTSAGGRLVVNALSDLTSGMLADGMSVLELSTGTRWERVAGLWRQVVTSTGVITYTPSIRALDGGFSLGDGTITGKYLRHSDGLTYLSILLTIGAATNMGSNMLRIGYPDGAHPVDSDRSMLKAMGQDVSAGNNRYVGLTLGNDMWITLAPALNEVGATVPFTWGSGDKLRISGTYLS